MTTARSRRARTATLLTGLALAVASAAAPAMGTVSHDHRAAEPPSYVTVADVRDDGAPGTDATWTS